MKEHPLLEQLALLTGEFVMANNPSAEQLRAFQTAIATALVQQQPLEKLRDTFRFERIENYGTAHLDADDLMHLNYLLQQVQEVAEADEGQLRIFRREVPFLSTELKSSVPDWARGAKIASTIGPLKNKEGRRVWFDIYRIYPNVKVYLQGAANPAVILTLRASNLIILNNKKDFSIPACSVWVNAHLFNQTAPDDQYIGLKVTSGKADFSQAITINNSSVIVSPGTNVNISLKFTQEVDNSVSPDNTGVDAKNAVVDLPDNLQFLFSHAGCVIEEAGNASWKLYEQEISFTAQPSNTFYLPHLNRIGISYISSEAEVVINKCLSNVCNLTGQAGVSWAGWSFSAAKIDLNNLLEASGNGAMILQAKKGLAASWYGLKDANLEKKEWIQLNAPWLLLEPGHIAISDLKASNTNSAMQQYKLYESGPGLLNWIDLSFTNQFYFLYNCLQAGNEAVVTQANCNGRLDRPVNVSGRPFALKSLQTICMLSYTQAEQYVVLYDDNVIVDNLEKIAPVPGAGDIPTFKSEAISLNNALLTVSPVVGFLLFGELKDEDEFEKAALLFSFGLMGYLPMLPDPYAADVGVFRNVYRRYESRDGIFRIRDISALLLCIMQWKEKETPAVNFFFGDIAVAAAQNNAAAANPAGSDTMISRLNILANKDFAVERAAIRRRELADLELNRSREITGNQDVQLTSYSEPLVHALANNPGGMTDDLFRLLDVSTNADLLGVSIGFVNEQFIFGESYKIEPIDTTKNPLAIVGMDVVATSRFVRIFTVPQISWEPLLNVTPPFNVNNDPPFGVLLMPNDGPPTLIGNTGKQAVTIAPIDLTKYVIEQYKNNTNFKAWSVFTLPFGIRSLARYNQENYYINPKPNTQGATLDTIHKHFKDGIKTGWQIVSKAGRMPQQNNHVFEGFTHQDTNLHWIDGTFLDRSVLSRTVTDIFNKEFSSVIGYRGVPVERYDFTGYGANIFSHWMNENAEIAETSQVKFDVWRGRTAHEIIQVRSILYPWAIRVVRTITMYRSSTGFVYRVDSGWRAESDGIYNFTTKNEPGIFFDFHPGIVKGVYNVRNIVESDDLATYDKPWFKTYGVYVDDTDGLPKPVGAGINLEIELVPVYFDADVLIDDVEEGKVDGFVPSKKMLGYLQVSPRGVIIPPEEFAALLNAQNGLGGPLSCLVNINNSGQKMRVNRVEVNPSRDAANKIVFVTAAKGTPVLPKDGSWSLVSHNKNTKEVLPITNNTVSLIRKGLFTDTELNNQVNPKEIAEASELFKNATDRLIQPAFLQNTDTQKVLFRNPFFKAGEKILNSTNPDLADAYRLLNGKGIFPKLEDLPSIDLNPAKYAMEIKEQGYKLLNKLDPSKALEQVLPKGPWYFVKTDAVKIYVEYQKTDKEGNKEGDGSLTFDINSEANKWVNKLNDITMVVDLAGLERLFMIRGKFDTAKGAKPEFKGIDIGGGDVSGPQLIPGKFLKPIIEILEILEAISTMDNYKDIAKKALKVAMSNSPNNWEYKFQADKEIPVVRFPPATLDGPTTPLRLEANLKLGCYFNLAMPIPPTGLPAPSAGAFIEFGAKLQVMCVSLAAATIYAVGQCNLRISGDSVKGPALYMKFAFGVELMVGLPVIGNVSVLYAVTVEISLDTTQITVGAGLLFRGRAEILGGIVTVTIQIEASGKIQKQFGGTTNCIAQVTFSLDISICFIIDISFTESWQESRQIA